MKGWGARRDVEGAGRWEGGFRKTRWRQESRHQKPPYPGSRARGWSTKSVLRVAKYSQEIKIQSIRLRLWVSRSREVLWVYDGGEVTRHDRRRGLAAPAVEAPARVHVEDQRLVFVSEPGAQALGEGHVAPVWRRQRGVPEVRR